MPGRQCTPPSLPAAGATSSTRTSRRSSWGTAAPRDLPPDQLLAVLADERAAGREPCRIEGRDVHGLRCAIQDQLGHPEPDRGRRLEPGPAVPAVQVEAVRPGLAEHRPL